MALADPAPRAFPQPAITSRPDAVPSLIHSRYTDRPLDWRTRASGLVGASAVLLAIAAATFVTWSVVAPAQTRPAPLVMELLPLAAPPEPVHDVPEGPAQIEQAARKPVEAVLPETPVVLIPQVSPQPVHTQPPTEPSAQADPVPETTAPKSIPAPPASQASSDKEPSWEAKLLAHLERHRRYPAASRARRDQGVAHVRFRMNRAGRVLEATLIRSSGIPELDRAALATIRRAQPLPPIPDGRPDPIDLSVPVEFFLR